MTGAAPALRAFRVHASGERHPGRVLHEASFEAAAIAYVEHLPQEARAASAVRVLVHDLEFGHEHSFTVQLDADGEPPAAP